MLPRPATEYASVTMWAKSLATQWGGAPLDEDPSRLDALVAFCEFFGKDPDELVQFCFLHRRDTGVRFLSKKRREEVAAKVREYVATTGLKGTEARRRSSNVLSFLSHNGILI